MPDQPYGDAFFDAQVEGALRSARIVAPIVMEYVRPSSVLDVGCGRGAWLRAFVEHGVETIQGLDGDYVDRSTLLIPPDCFVGIDLEEAGRIRGSYDLALCIEVAEHLPPRVSERLVGALTRCAPVVLFSAALPGQGGTHHVNEQWPTFWQRLFAAHGFRPLDIVRPRILTDRRIEWWYRQNLTLYVSDAALDRLRPLRAAAKEMPGAELEWVHVTLLLRLATTAEPRLILALLRLLAARAFQRIRQTLAR